jgi:hypothetical protein
MSEYKTEGQAIAQGVLLYGQGIGIFTSQRGANSKMKLNGEAGQGQLSRWRHNKRCDHHKLFTSTSQVALFSNPN